MAVFRVERNTGYTVMSNHHLRNKELSLKAKGLLLIHQAGLQAHIKSVNLGAARCSQWTRYIGAQYSAYRLTDCVIFPLLFLLL